MKKLLLILLLLAPSAMGADYLATFKQYRFAVRQAFNVDTTVTSGVVFRDTTLNDIIRKNVIHYVNATKCYPHTQVISTAYKDGDYNLDSLLLGISAVYWSEDDSLKSLVYTPKSTWYSLDVTPTDKNRKYAHRSSYYDYDDDEIELYPVPTKHGTADSILVEGWRRVSNIAAHDSLYTIDQRYRPLILTAVCYDVARAQSSPVAQLWLMELNAMRNEFNLPPIGGQVAQGNQ